MRVTANLTGRTLTRRTWLGMSLGAISLLAFGGEVRAQSSRMTFGQWIEAFRARALQRGISEKTYTRVMSAVKPDTSVYAADKSQPEFTEQLWQYLNRRCYDFRVRTGKLRLHEHDALLPRIERDYRLDRFLLLGLGG